MIKRVLKRLAAMLPEGGQQALKRRHFRSEIRRGSFRTDEPEWDQAARWLKRGDWAIDVGANVGHYTKRFSDLVGPPGRVVAFEPVPATFELLAANAANFQHANVTLLNVAASDSVRAVQMTLPRFDSGLANYYQAAITAGGEGGIAALTIPIDSLDLPGPVRVLKIDAEGHDLQVLRGARSLLERDRPVVVIESADAEVTALMQSLGYAGERFPRSSNMVYRRGSAAPMAHG